jgi:hypothetical protein
MHVDIQDPARQDYEWQRGNMKEVTRKLCGDEKGVSKYRNCIHLTVSKNATLAD